MATNTELLAQVVQTNTALTNTIETELDKWQGERAESKAHMQQAVNTVVNNDVRLFIDGIKGDDVNDGLSVDRPLKTIDKALNMCKKNKGCRLYFEAGQTYTITKVHYIGCRYLGFYTRLDSIAKKPNFPTDDASVFKENYATIENQVLIDQNESFVSNKLAVSGIRPVPTSPLTINFDKVYLFTPVLPNEWRPSIWTGLILRMDFTSSINISSVSCYWDLGTPLVKLASGRSCGDFSSYMTRCNLNRLITDGPYDKAVFSTSNQPAKCAISGIYTRDTSENIGSIRKYFVHGQYPSSDPELPMNNLISNFNNRRSSF
ncbi:hypothetical protein PCIT_a2994 [Pseudoalteromonas citrea]|uniref:Uncharacterized protein n=2 Tax=Pseudoalteromonas citrea TaxID=43655 RepID=A0AAD4AI81_9GAMM|nr:hypothetical protein [Pseudoalteromonas citrea]KAF7770045.1 hypothetical protein PCIT_a2994 [Pseudoalteromonas citrea]